MTKTKTKYLRYSAPSLVTIEAGPFVPGSVRPSLKREISLKVEAKTAFFPIFDPHTWVRVAIKAEAETDRFRDCRVLYSKWVKSGLCHKGIIKDHTVVQTTKVDDLVVVSVEVPLGFKDDYVAGEWLTVEV